MKQVEEIRRLDAQGVSQSEIAARLGVARRTVRKYERVEDFQVPRPVAGKGSQASILDPLKPVIDEILTQDKLVWRKQRHTAKRVWERLRDEHGFQGQYSLVQRYVKAWRAQDRVESESGGFNRLEWAPGTAQVDFGEVDVDEPGGRSRLSYLEVSFPYSNQGFTQLFRGETSECVCQGLLDVFTVIGGVPPVIVFDNATGVGRRVGEVVREADVFRRFRLHHRFEARFCNPYSGHEKGNVENKVGAVRRSLFVPVPYVDDVPAFNEGLLARAVDDTVVHYRKQVPVADLFAEDQARLVGLPARVFDVVRWGEYLTDKYGYVVVDGVHAYSVSPQMPRARVVVGFRAHTVEVATVAGDTVATHPRLFGKRRAEAVDHVTMMTALVFKPGAWPQSGLRAGMPDGAGKDFLDGLGKRDLSIWLAGVRDQAVAHGLAETQDALDWLAGNRPGFTVADLAAVAGRAAGFGLAVAPDEGPDLSYYDDAFLTMGVAA